MMRRVLVFASLVLAAAGLMAPAAQAGTKWTNTGNFEATGNITMDRGFQTGPAVATFEVELFNGVEHGEGSVTGGEIAGAEIPTNLPNCTAQIKMKALPWGITLTEPDTIDIEDVTFENIYSAGCAAFGIPAKLLIFGDITGTVENTVGGDACINLNKYTDDLHIEGSGEAPPTVDLTAPGNNFCIIGTKG